MAQNDFEWFEALDVFLSEQEAENARMHAIVKGSEVSEGQLIIEAFTLESPE